MKIQETKKEELKREYKVTLTPEEIDAKIDARLQELSSTFKVPGFRPGKAPMNVLKTKYGSAVRGEVLEKIINESTMKAINENSLRPAMQPRIDLKSYDEGKGLEYDMIVELLPEISLMAFDKISLTKHTATPQEKAIADALERIASSQKSSEIVEEKRAAKNGEIVTIDFDGTVGGKALPGMKGEGYQLELGSHSFVGTFEEQLVGTKVGDKKTVTVTFPADYPNKELADKEAKFEVSVKELRKVTAPKVDDAFAKQVGFDNLEKLKEVVVAQMKGDYDQLARMTLKRALLDTLDEGHDFPVPAGMVENEFEGIWRQVKAEHNHAHDHDAPGHVHGPDCNHDHEDESEKAEYRDIAKRRVKLGLILAEIGKQNKIEVTVQELQQAVVTEARRFPGREREVFEYYQKNRQAAEMLKAPIYEEKVVDLILERSIIKDNQVTIEELTKLSEEEAPKAAGEADKKKKSSSKK